MLEKVPSGAMSAPEAAPKSSDAPPGGAFPQAGPAADPNVNPPQPSRQYGLHFLVEILQKFSKK